MRTKAERDRQTEALARGFAADVRTWQATTAELAARIAGVVMQPVQAGQHQRATVDQMARAAGLHDSAPGDLGAVVRISGRAYR